MAPSSSVYGAQARAALREGIRRLNESHGVANSESGGYHETITRAYVSIVGAYLASFDEAVPLAARVDALVGGALGGRDLLFEYWTRERLLSSEARLAWAPPDRDALELARVLRPRG